jgi:membrane-associated protein
MLALTPLLAALGPAALLLIMLVVAAESAAFFGFLLPGDSLLFTAGVLVASGAIALPAWALVLGVVVAAAAGDQVGYLVGRCWGPRLLSGRSSSRFLDPRHGERAQAFFERHGPRAVVLARFVPVVRCLAPAVAGLSRMPRRRFTAYNLIGAAAWGTGVPLAGWLLGGVPFVAAHVELCLLALVALTLAPGLGALVRSHGRRSARILPAAAAARLAPPPVRA